MSDSMPHADHVSRVNSVERPKMAKAKLTISEVDRAANLARLAIARSGIQLKTLGEDRGRLTRLLNGSDSDRLWFHDMLATWPPVVWRELLPLIALEVCGEYFEVERSVTITERKRA